MTDSAVTPFESIDFFTDDSVTINNPYPFYEYLRSKGPVAFEPYQGVAVVTGHAEATQVYRNYEVFSACDASTGPFYGFAPAPGADDVTEDLERYRVTTPLQFMGFMDPPRHQKYRDIVKRLFTPKRFRENEDFMWGLADRQLDTFLSNGRCEFIHDYAQPFTVLVIADLLGVPEDDREALRQILLAVPPTGAIREDEDSAARSSTALVMPEDIFINYIAERRRNPRDDILTHLAVAKFPDGETPDVTELAREAAFMFVAGGETTTRLLGFLLRHLADHPEFQEKLRRERQLIPNFVEEMLRMENPVRAHFRLARRTTKLGGVDIPAGTTVMLLIAAVNRDPRRFDEPHEFRYDRPNAQDHISFSRGAHSCLGMSLARAESRVSLERVLDRMNDIKVSEAEHGRIGAQHYEYDPTFVFRGMKALHLTFNAA